MTNQFNNIHPVMIQFQHLIGLASAISLDNGPLLTDWVLESDIDYSDPNDLVLTCTYTGHKGDFEESFTVGNISNGVWSNSGDVFELQNSRNEPTKFQFFLLKLLNKDGSVFENTMSDLSADFLNTLNTFTTDTLDEFIQLLEKHGWRESLEGGNITHPTICSHPSFTSWSNLIQYAINNSAAANKQTKVYVEINKGMCSWNADGNVDVHIRDLDIEPNATVPDGFKHLAS